MNETNASQSSSTFGAVLGCLVVLCIFFALAAGVAYCGYQYWFSEESSEGPGPRIQTSGNEGPSAPISSGPAFTPNEEREIQTLLANLGSSDAEVCADAWRRIYPLHQKNALLMRQRLASALKTSTERNFVYQATWGLCTYYGNEGKLAVIQTAKIRRNEPNLLTGIVEAISRLTNKADRDDMLDRTRQALEEVHSPFSERFSK